MTPKFSCAGLSQAARLTLEHKRLSCFSGLKTGSTKLVPTMRPMSVSHRQTKDVIGPEPNKERKREKVKG